MNHKTSNFLNSIFAAIIIFIVLAAISSLIVLGMLAILEVIKLLAHFIIFMEFSWLNT